MHVLLVMPYSPNDIRDSLGFITPPLGLGYIANYLRHNGQNEVRIHDGMLHQTTDSEFIKVLEGFCPSVVGISAQATPAIYDVYRTARIVKHFDPTTLVVVGGAHATFEDKEVLDDCPYIDVIVRGEGELVMSKLLTSYGSCGFADVPGITYRKGYDVIRNPRCPLIQDLDSLPFPAYDLLDLSQYFNQSIRTATMITSRGCPFGCTFCSSSRSTGKRWRSRSAANVLDEVKLLINQYHIQELEFLDDLFSYDIQRVHEICTLFEEYGINIGWTCSARADILSQHPEMAEWLKSAGCHSVYMGVESGSPRILKLMRKGISLAQVKKAAKILKDVGLKTILSFIIGYPGEIEEDIKATINLACRLDPDFAQFTVCTPYPGTPLYEKAKQKGWIHAKSWKDYSVLGSVMNFPRLSAKKIKEYLHKAYLRFYLRPSYLWKQVKARNGFLISKMVQGVKTYIQRLGQIISEGASEHESRWERTDWSSIIHNELRKLSAPLTYASKMPADLLLQDNYLRCKISDINSITVQYTNN